jgi:predicted RNase H-like HicB family nuclease
MASRQQVIQVRIDGTVPWLYAQDPESGTWIGICTPLNVTAVGDTYAELQAAFSETTALMFADLFEDGELEAFLRRHGWHVTGPLPAPGGAVQFDIPLNVNRTSVREMVPAGA